MVKQGGIIAERKCVMVYYDGGSGVNTFNFVIDINFLPDEMVVRQISYYDNSGGATNNVLMVTSDLTDFQPMFTIIDSTTFSTVLENRFPIYQQVRGIHTFNFLSIDRINFTSQCQIAFLLEFIRYE